MTILPKLFKTLTRTVSAGPSGPRLLGFKVSWGFLLALFYGPLYLIHITQLHDNQ